MIEKFCSERDWIRNLAVDPKTASNTSVCLSVDLEKDQVREKKELVYKTVVVYGRCMYSLSR